MLECRSCRYWTYDAYHPRHELRRCSHPQAAADAERICRDGDGKPYSADFLTGANYPCPYPEGEQNG